MSVVWRKVVLFSVFIALLTATACSSKNNADSSQRASAAPPSPASSTASGSASPDRSEYVIKAFSEDASWKLKRSDETAVGKIIKEKFGIVLEYVPFSGDYRNQLNLMLASGDYPEILRLEQNDLVQKYIKAGAALPLDEYLPNMPNFSEAYQNQIPYWRLAADDGKLYKWEMRMPQEFNPATCDCLDMAIRHDVLKEAGYPTIVNSDDYIAFLKAALEKHPTTNGKKTIGMTLPLAESWGVAGLTQALYQKGANIAGVGNGAVVFDLKDQKFVDMFLNPYVKESFQFMNKAYRAGLINDESFTAKLDQVTEQINSGQALSIFYTVWTVEPANRTFEQAGNKDSQYVRMPIQSPAALNNREKRLVTVENVRPFDSVIITKNTKHPERIVELLEYLSSDEGQILVNTGVEGVDYTMVDGKRVLSADFEQRLASGDFINKDGAMIFQIFGLMMTKSKSDGQFYNLTTDPGNISKSITPTVLEAYRAMGWSDPYQWWEENAIVVPKDLIVTVQVDPASAIGAAEQKLIQFRVKNTPQLILAKDDADFEALYQKLSEQYNQLKPQQVWDEYNRQYQELAAKVKK